MKEKYPRLLINLDKLKENIETAIREGGELGISVCGVVKGASATDKCLPAYLESDLKELGSSRLEQLKKIRDMGWTKDLLLLRVPMLSEVSDVIELADISLNSELTVLEALNREALKVSPNKPHKVILMADLGDLREGYWNKEEMIEVAVKVEREMPGLYLYGVGTNLGCYGALVPTAEKIGELIPIAEEIENRIGRKLDIISGGGSTSYPRITDKDMPERVNHLRVGENILHARDNEVFHGHSTSPMNKDVFILQAEVIEVKDKPSYPVGEINVDAFGNKPEYEDKGIRRKALLAVGKVDFGDYKNIYPKMEGIEVLGCSSDHTVLDIQNAVDMGHDIKVGDVLEFGVDYGSLVFLTASENVDKSIYA